MIRFSATALAAALLCIGLAPIAARAGTNSQITTRNFTDDYVWITSYQGSWHSGSAHAWCVKPQTSDTHGIAAYIYDVRAEVSRGGCQRHPILLDETRRAAREMRDGAFRSTFHVVVQNGHFEFGSPL